MKIYFAGAESDLIKLKEVNVQRILLSYYAIHIWKDSIIKRDEKIFPIFSWIVALILHTHTI